MRWDLAVAQQPCHIADDDLVAAASSGRQPWSLDEGVLIAKVGSWKQSDGVN